jgi:hypothetical protein
MFTMQCWLCNVDYTLLTIQCRLYNVDYAIIKCLYQFVFKFSQFLDFKLTYLPNYWRFSDFNPLYMGLFQPYDAYFHTLKLNKWDLTTIECLKCIIKCLYQLVFKFSQFLDFKLTYLLNYWRFSDFGPFMWAFFQHYGTFLHTLKLNKGDLSTIGCLKCIIKCLYQLVFKFSQFLDFKLTYLLNYWRFSDFDPFKWALFSLIGTLYCNLKLNKRDLTTIECLKCIIKCL